MFSRLDHIVVAAKTLEQGTAYVRDVLGVDMPSGGKHDFMGTHNCVMALGETAYLEVIALDPTLHPPCHPRWFGLDDPHLRKAIARSPRLLTWAVNTSDIDLLASGSAVPLGNVVAAHRDDLKWKVAFREDGTMPAAGFIPLCIEWQVDFHQASRMTDFGWTLKSLCLFHHRPEWLRAALKSIGASGEVDIQGIDDSKVSRLEAVLTGPNGQSVTLG